MERLFIEGLLVDRDEIPAGSYVRDIPSLSGLTELRFTSPVTFFCGDNGSGKSTLLEAIALCWGFNPEGGTVNYDFSTYDSHSPLFEAMTLVKGPRKPSWGYFFRAESFYNVATMEMEYRGDRSMAFHSRSHGESFLALAGEQFRENCLIIMDEPEAALSPGGQLSLLKLIDESASSGSQFIIASHSPILMGYPGCEILSFGEDGIVPVGYEETDSYRITSMFLRDRGRILHSLLGED